MGLNHFKNLIAGKLIEHIHNVNRDQTSGRAGAAGLGLGNEAIDL